MSEDEKSKSSNTRLLIVVLIILLPLISVSIGFFGVQFLMGSSTEEVVEAPVKTTKSLLEGKQAESESVSNKIKDDEKAEEPKTSEETDEIEKTEEIEESWYTLPTLVTYNIQIGSFDEPSNANKMIGSLKKNGLAGYSYRIDNYKVFVMSFLEKENAEVNKVFVSNNYNGAYITEVQLAPKKISYLKEDEVYIHCLRQNMSSVIDILNSYTKYIHTYPISAFDHDDFNVYLIAQHNEISKIKEEIVDCQVSDQLKKHQSQVVSFLDNIENQFQYLINTDSPSLEEIWSRTMKMIFEYKNI